MDPFALVLLAGLVALIAWVWLLGRLYPGSGREHLGLSSARELAETREALDAEDLEQMLAAHNARRRARGEHGLTVEDVELAAMEDRGVERRHCDAFVAGRELGDQSPPKS